MKLLEHQGKALLARGGLRTPRSELAGDADAAVAAARAIGGRVVVKAQVPTGKRGKAGGVLFADDAEAAGRHAQQLLSMELAGHKVHELLVEECSAIALELYAAVVDDPSTKGPLILFSTSGGMDIEEVNATHPERVFRLSVDISRGPEPDAVLDMVAQSDLPEEMRASVARALAQLYAVYLVTDADLAEVNPLVVTDSGEVLALDAKMSVDPGSLPRQQDVVGSAPELARKELTDLERRGRDLGLQFIELDGDVGVLANGAGLTMATLDVVNHFGGKPANFLEIGGDAYTKATSALALVLDNPRVNSLLVNFCGAFARTDVMTEGVLDAIEELRPRIPIFFTIHGTGEAEAITMVRDRLGVEPFDLMDDAIKAAVAAASATTSGAR
jgi:succinyl-CoA synthetase beta subunit